MGILSWLWQRTPSECTLVEIAFEEPPEFFVEVEPVEDEQNEVAETELRQTSQPPVEHRRFDLEPIFVVIDYCDAAGNRSRRRITTRWIEKRGDVSYIGATCHERRAHRLFRMDRVEGVINDDGVVVEARCFFEDAISGDPGYEIERTVATSQKITVGESTSHYTLLRRELKPALVVLVAAARVDDVLHSEEIDRIMLFTETEAECLVQDGAVMTLPGLEGFDKLGRLVHRIRPIQSDLDEALGVIAEWPEQRLQRLIQGIAGVVQADGVIVSSEFDFLNELTEWVRERNQ